MKSRDGSQRNYELQKPLENVSVLTSGITQNSVNLDWTQYDFSAGNFSCYQLLVSTVEVYDPYNEAILDENRAEQNYRFFDAKRTKFRVYNLTANTLYYITLVYRGVNGNDYFTTSFTTLS